MYVTACLPGLFMAGVAAYFLTIAMVRVFAR
jgi:hypothetical protein